MRNLTISDEKEHVYIFRGMIVSENDIDILERIAGRLFARIDKLEKNAAEGMRLNALEHSHDTLWKASTESKKIIEEMRAEIALLSRKYDHDHKAHTRIYKEMDEQEEVVEILKENDFQRTETDIKRDKRISDIEEFVRDI